ncbi:MAG: TolB-like 6-bladed beta-propeller domain-containing protein [Gemmatimonadetes bacterium]|nr:TolB-like 6-bladed beta-propeller domain-containing protein [Gemmatimonadota bacterium]
MKYLNLKTLLVLPIAALSIGMVADRELPAKPVEAAVEARLEPSRVLPAKVLHESDALAAPTDVEVMGPSLVIADDFADRSLRLLRRSDGAIERSFGGKGEGPREFESAWSIDVVDQGGEFMVLDLALQRVTWVDVREDFRGDAWVADRSVKLKAGTMLLETSWTPRGMLGLGILEEGRLAHLDDAGALLRTSGPTPMDGQNVPPDIRMQAYQSKLKPNPARTRWVVATRYADRLEIYDAAGVLVAEGTRPYRFEPVYEANRSTRAVSMASNEEMRFGYLDVATTDDRIYALFSGRTRGEGRANYGNTLHVFDWSGTLLEIVRLEAHVIALAVDPEGESLYGLRHDPFPAVLEFEL